jgi:hypothetical protein
MQYPPTSDSSALPAPPPGYVTGDESSHAPTVEVGQIDPLSASQPLTTPARFVCGHRHRFGPDDWQFWACTRPAAHGGTQHVATVDVVGTVIATWPRS